MIGTTAVSSGSVVLDEDEDEPVEVSTPTTVNGTPFTSTVWPTGSMPRKSSDAVVAPEDGDGGVVGDVLVVDEAALGHACAPAR